MYLNYLLVKSIKATVTQVINTRVGDMASPWPYVALARLLCEV